MVMCPYRVAGLLKDVNTLDDLERVIECVEKRGWFVEVYRICGHDERYYDFYRVNRPYCPPSPSLCP